MDPNDVALGVTPDNWWFIGKRRLISLLLRRYCPKNAEILDVGAGMGEDLHVILPFGKVTVLDSSKNAVASVKKQFPKVSAYCNLIENVKFNKKFDAILAFDVLEHIKKDFSAVNNILNLLKPGGVLIGSVPAWPNLWSSHDRHLDHFRRYTPNSLRRLLKQFDIMLMSFWNFTLYPAVACLRLVQRVLPVKPSPGRLPKIVNSFLAKVLMFESMLSSKGLSPPYGVTLVFVARRR